MPEFGGSCGGGGRYDKMVGKFTGNDVPACGFSIGFERIILLLMESGFKVPGAPERTAYLLEKGLPADRLCEVIAEAQEERKNFDQNKIHSVRAGSFTEWIFCYHAYPKMIQ